MKVDADVAAVLLMVLLPFAFGVSCGVLVATVVAP